LCAQRKYSDRAAVAYGTDDDDDDGDGDRHDVTETGTTTFAGPDGVTCGKRGRQTDRDEVRRSRSSDLASLDDFRFRCSTASTYNKSVTNGTIAQHYCFWLSINTSRCLQLWCENWKKTSRTFITKHYITNRQYNEKNKTKKVR